MSVRCKLVKCGDCRFFKKCVDGNGVCQIMIDLMSGKKVCAKDDIGKLSQVSSAYGCLRGEARNRFVVTKGSECGTLVKGDHITIYENGYVGCCEAGGFLLKEEFEQIKCEIELE